MPLCQIDTNLPLDKIPENLEDEMISLISELAQAPSTNICIQINAGLRMKFFDKADPVIMMHLFSITHLTEEECPSHVPRLTEKIKELTGVPADRFTIFFNPENANLVGFNGSIVGKK